MTGAKVLCLVAVLAVFGGPVVLSGQSTPFLPGITVKDDYPNGCVDCHMNGKAISVIAELAKVSGHPKVDKVVKSVPKDCLICHKTGPKPPVFSQAMHLVHYAKPSENDFVTTYKGACLSCHILDTSTGEMVKKNGPKNW